jgi:predicted nuclease of restriction endonuclease-like (RecB) superfamily
MKFDQLSEIIKNTQDELHKATVYQTNIFLTIRNWLTGYYIVEFEQKGEDRAVYGDRLLSRLAKELKMKGLKGFSYTQLSLYRQFYFEYETFKSFIINNLQVKGILLTVSEELGIKILPTVSEVFGNQISQTLSEELNKEILLRVSGELDAQKSLTVSDQLGDKISPTVSEKFKISKELLTKLSFSHFIELLKLDTQTQREFYEFQAIKLSWSVRQLRREIESMLYERIGLSKNKEKMISKLDKGLPDTSYQIIKSPIILEFLGIEERAEYSETDLETAIINHLQKFLMELGYGFCFEARQKRIIIDNTPYKIDLVFYHRILKCHVLIDLKVGSFSHADAGQMNFYLNYYKDNEMNEGDNPPVGIILCSYKNESIVKYATGGLEHDLFVSKYLINLPKVEELKQLIESDMTSF